LARRVAPESAVTPTPGALLARARKELAAGNARAALSVYERLRATHPTSPEARTVLVTIGKLELDLKQPARALASFDTYLAARGALAPEALAGKIRALRALGRADDERRAIETYLARHPDGFDAPLLRQRLEVLQGR
jgi:tetratricopeptide (TPR) repeat protein